uniref:MYND-type domain-containing protein n=1 Tax=Chromera velia CCMP2878 TaxID=1169474 RepID=A0A0G4GLQ1_9ALVE|eukprot:Cvel_22451.t1-p1 / transcript=Cvel_22451.t1 / gene=Cvel_22451 / organism=Chromera_velia_CCMP2878 / gene_product=Zinc finger MYND domain-containing protein 12, putative / transcript_product=Zinc finger MYND domain-containing protein 12, putative / location=Cvel_scaffold2207:7599-11641(+) / protein_length=341 / sequence_SO=supercontig / SO=protein_coding / is_pseudo=false
MTTIPITALSRSKGVKLECEICGKPACLKCSSCPTYYCSREHFQTDWNGILNLIADDINVLRSKPKLIGSEQERHKRKEELKAIRKEVLELCVETAHKYLIQGNFELAVPGALYGLKLALELHGNEALELVPSYLLLAEANLGLHRLKVAEEFLSLANWSLLKYPKEKAGHRVMSSLQRNFGRLYAAQRRHQESLRAFATDVYHSAREYGPEDVKTAPSYFHMGRVFQSHHKVDQAQAFYDKVLNIYGTWLATERALKEKESSGGAPASESKALASGGSGTLGDVELDEAVEIAGHIVEYRAKKLGVDSPSAKEAKVIFIGLVDKCRELKAQIDGEMEDMR